MILQAGTKERFATVPFSISTPVMHANRLRIENGLITHGHLDCNFIYDSKYESAIRVWYYIIANQSASNDGTNGIDDSLKYLRLLNCRTARL